MGGAIGQGLHCVSCNAILLLCTDKSQEAYWEYNIPGDVMYALGQKHQSMLEIFHQYTQDVSPCSS